MDVDGTRLDSELDALLLAIQPELTTGEVTRPAGAVHPWSSAGIERRPRPLVRVAVAAVSLSGVVAVTLAGASVAKVRIPLFDHARTGTYAHDEPTDVIAGEFLEMSAADMPEVIRDLTSDIPFAPGYEEYQNYTFTVWLVSSQQAQMSESVARAEVAHQAICSWADYWVASARTGDLTARRLATSTLVASLDWDAVRAVDPHPDAEGEIGDDGEPFPTIFGNLPATIAAAQSTDPDAVARSLFVDGSTSCAPGQLRAIDGDRLLVESARRAERARVTESAP